MALPGLLFALYAHAPVWIGAALVGVVLAITLRFSWTDSARSQKG